MSRFGARTPIQNYYSQIRWLVGGMLSLILLLSFCLIFVATTWNKAESRTSEPGLLQEATEISLVEIPVAAKRIEVGEEITAAMVELQAVPFESIPLDTLQTSERASLWGMYSTAMIAPGMPITHSAISNRRPVEDLAIPAGFRAVTISLNRRQAAAGFAIPGSRVDVLLRYKDRKGTAKVRAFAKFIKVLAVNGTTKAKRNIALREKNVEVTLLANIQDAKRIELAQSVGELSLSLLGKETAGPDTKNSEEVDIWKLLGGDFEKDAEPIIDGKFFTTDPDSGQIVAMHLIEGRWTRVSLSE